MAATALNLLTAALSPTGYPSDTGSSPTATANQTQTVTGLFQSILKNAVSQATTDALTTQTSTTSQASTLTTTAQSLFAGTTTSTTGGATSLTDELTTILALLKNSSSNSGSDQSGNLLSQLFASLGLNAQQLLQSTPTANSGSNSGGTSAVSGSSGTSASALLAALTNATANTATTANPSTLNTLLPATTAFLAQATQPTATTTTAAITAAASSAAATTTTTTALPATGTTVPQATTISEANQVASRTAGTVFQTPISQDRGQLPPQTLASVGGDSIQPPVNEPTAIKGLPPVSPGERTGSFNSATPDAQPPATQNNNAVISPFANNLAANQAGTATSAPATNTVTANRSTATTAGPVTGNLAPANTTIQSVTVTQTGSTARPSATPTTPTPVATPTTPTTTTAPVAATATASTTAAPATAATTTSGTTSTTDAKVPVLGTSTTQPGVIASPTTAPTPRPASPDIAITAAQPILVPPGQLDVGKFSGNSAFGNPFPNADTIKTTSNNSSIAIQQGGPNPAPTQAPQVDQTAPATSTGPTTPTAAAQLAGPVAAQVRATGTNGSSEIQIRLDPPDLGSVKLKIVSTGGDVRAELHVSSDAVRHVVESQMPELRQRLDDAGVKVQSFQVTTDSSGGQAQNNRGNSGQQPAVPYDLPTPVVASRSSITATPSTPSRTGRVDVSV